MTAELLSVVLAAAASGPCGESMPNLAGTPCVEVDPGDWRVVMCAVRDHGGRLDWLAAVDVDDDEPGAVDVVAEVLTPAASVLLRARVPAGTCLPSVRDVFASAAWHEREAAEFVGVAFDGGDPRPLLLADRGEGADAGEVPAVPLRRRTPLPARLHTPWPGATPQEGAAARRRPPRVPGVNPEWREP